MVESMDTTASSVRHASPTRDSARFKLLEALSSGATKLPAGISRGQSSKWQAIASLGEVFEQALHGLKLIPCRELFGASESLAASVSYRGGQGVQLPRGQ